MHFTPEQLAEMQRQFDASPKYSAVSPQNKFNSVVSLPGSKNLLSYISYTPAERNQGYCGDCWVWAATGALEIDHSVNNNIDNRLSIQYFNSKFNNGSGGNWACCGGYLSLFTNWYNTDRTVLPWSNTNASFGDVNTLCGANQTHVPVGLISATPHYNLTSISSLGISTYKAGQDAAVNNIKSSLDANKAVVYSFWYGNPGWSAFDEFWSTSDETTIFNPDSYAGEDVNSGHSVLIVGYNDTVPGSEYWLVLNSWGSRINRPNDLFRLKMYMNYDAAYN
jgi:C1A family cysteine protease